MLSKQIHEGWKFTQVGGGQVNSPDEWMPVSEFPTTVHVELLKLGKINDPFLALNEWDVQWIGETTWAFKNTFDVTEKEYSQSNVDLVFDGLDTFAIVELNGSQILQTSNQFIGHRVAVKEFLKVGSNDLTLTFESAFFKGKEIEKKELGGEKYGVWNGDSSRVHVRKAQYNYGWDWGPILMTVGPWKPISLDAHSLRIDDFDIRSKVSTDLSVSVSFDFTLSSKSKNSASLVLKSADGSVKLEETNITVDGSHGRVESQFPSGILDLWYPIGYGAQPLYTAELTILDEQGQVLDNIIQKIAFRRARIVEEKLIDQKGLSFFFEINNIPIFCGGSNWIPADSFLTTVKPDRYRAWLQLMADGNQNMVRVWGGGIYEMDAFYDICDELGIMVWNDFMFGCGQYPAYESFLKSVQEEAEQAVKRIRHHPSLVIWAGNNEDYQLAESLKLDLDYSDETSDFTKTNFPARHIYERLLPAVVKKLSDTHYHRASPYSGQGQITTDKTLGDIHQWNVWHGTQEPWQNWDILAGRFVSEFGMQGLPNIRTVEHWLGGDASERFPQSRSNANHNKADGFERRLALYLVENFRHSFEMESYIYYTQVMQAETLAAAYRLWRRNWRGPGREYTAGALVWQINDCWPCVSWAIADYFLRPKPAYFTIARELRPFTVGMTRKESTKFDNEQTNAFMSIDTQLEIWGTNSTLRAKDATLEVSYYNLDTNWTDKTSVAVTLAPNSSTELYAGKLIGQETRTKKSEYPQPIVVSARLLEGDIVLGRYSNWPEPFKFIKFPEVHLTIATQGETVTLSTDKPIKGIILDVEGEEVKWNDQAIDLFPGDPQTVSAVGLAGRTVMARYLGDGTA